MLVLLAVALLHGCPTHAALPVPFGNLVPNGDFEDGLPGYGATFGSDYAFQNFTEGNGIPNGGQLVLSGRITIDTTSAGWNEPHWPIQVTDTALPGSDPNTGVPWPRGNREFLIANGSQNVDDLVWRTLTPIPVTDQFIFNGLTYPAFYYFEAFVANLNGPEAGQVFTTLSFALKYTPISGPPQQFHLATIVANDAPGVWRGVSSAVNFPADGTIHVMIRNEQASGIGNDFALDDIYFGRVIPLDDFVPEVPALLPVLAGLCLGGLRLAHRRHRQNQRPLAGTGPKKWPNPTS